ncbi:ribonuclease H-like domain-containing protein [Tanacetum coccineum]
MSVHNSVHISDDDEVEPNLVFTFISKLDLSHPLHFHPNDSTTLTIVSIKLKGTENYNVWSCAMLLAIEGRNKIGFIDNSCERSNTDEVLGSQWDRVNVVFLMGLYVFYMQLRSNILSRDPLPDAKGAYVLISSEESHKAVVTGLGARSSQRAQSSVFNSSVNNRDGTQRSQTFGNTSRPNNVHRPNNNGNRRIACGLTLVYEHYGFNGNTIDSSTSSISDEQISKLISLIKENSLNDNGKSVQVNMAGANQHLTYTDKNLVNIIDISYLGIKVSHPNGTEALITKVAKNGKSPYQLVFNKKPSLKHLRVFWCLCFATILSNHDKFSNRAEKYVLIGYSSFKKWYKLFSLERKQFVFSREVKFFENVFPFKLKHNSVDNGQSDGSNSSPPSSLTIDHFEGDLGHPQGSNGFASENEMAATSDYEFAFSKDDDYDIQTTKHVQNVIN